MLMTPQEFIAKWKKAQLSERSAAQQHFLDLCELLGQSKPAAADPEGAWYTFERGVHKTGGGEGWADVWMKGKFANQRDWSNVEPSIIGTLFERTLDPAKRSQIGAHYTSRQDILTLLEPVVMAPLRSEWAEVEGRSDLSGT
jgi:hypothetical protein